MTHEGRRQILDSAATTSGLYTLSLSKISGFTLPLPPIEEQKRFLEIAHQSDKSKFAVLKSSNLNLSGLLSKRSSSFMAHFPGGAHNGKISI